MEPEGTTPVRARGRHAVRVAPMGCGARAFFAWMWITGAGFFVGSWRGGGAAPVFVGLVLFGFAAAITAGSRPARLTQARRRPIAETLAAGGWSWRRVLMLSAAAAALVLVPMTCTATALRDATGWWVAIASVTLAVTGILLARRRPAATWHSVRKEERARAADPSAEWTWDYPWDERGTHKSFRAYLGTRGMYLGRLAAVAGLLMLPFPSDGSAEAAVVSALRIALAFAGSVWLLRVWWILGMGQVVLGYLKFPVHPGERAEFTLGVSEGGAEIRDAEVVLRHFRESREGTGPGSGLPLATATISASEPKTGETFPAGVHRKVVFEIPADAPGTAISSSHPSYWAVEIRGRTRAGPYEERLLVPVYARRAASRDAAAPATPA